MDVPGYAAAAAMQFVPRWKLGGIFVENLNFYLDTSHCYSSQSRIGGEKEKNNKGEWSTFVSITSFPNCSKNKQWKLNILFAGLGSEIVKWWKVGSEK